MMNFANLHAIMDEYRRQTGRQRMTSGEKRALALRKEEKRLTGQKS